MFIGLLFHVYIAIFFKTRCKDTSPPKGCKDPKLGQKNDITSDQNCVPSCGLRLGADKNFEASINEERDRSDKAGRKANNLGLSGEEYDRFLPILKDVIFNIFTDPNEEKIFLKALRGMHDKFPDTLDGSKKTISLF